MVMKSTSICFDAEVYNLITRQAELEGMNVTEFMRKAILAKLADSFDYAEAARIKRESNEETVSRENVLKELGFN